MDDFSPLAEFAPSFLIQIPLTARHFYFDEHDGRFASLIIIMIVRALMMNFVPKTSWTMNHLLAFSLTNGK